MNVFLELLVLMFNCLWLWLLSVYKAVVPASLQARKDIQGWVVLVTGAGSGIGRLQAIRFAGLGCRIVLWDVNEAGNKLTAQLAKEAAPGCEVTYYTVDLSKREDVYTVARKVKEDVGDVDILINNAGIVTGTMFLESPDALNIKTMEVNCFAHFWTVKSFLPAMLAKDQGHVVTIASSAGLFGAPKMADYCASKFAAVGFDECLRAEINKLGKTGVKTTVVCPFLIDTGMFKGFKFRFPQAISYLEPSYVADKIVEAVLTDQVMLCIPKTIYVFYILRGILPHPVFKVIGDFLGTPKAMDDFVGRKTD